MGSIFYWSDLHYNHALVAMKRGFTKLGLVKDKVTGEMVEQVTGDTEAHDASILQRVNKAVKKGDRLIIVGDFAMNWAGVDEYLKQMNGENILVVGNHDPMFAEHRDAWRQYAPWLGPDKFAGIVPSMRRKVGSHEWLVSHFPYIGDHTGLDRCTQYRLRDEGKWLVHGHTHLSNRESQFRQKYWWADGSYSWRGQQLHVGVDAWPDGPVREDEIVRLITKAELVDKP